MNPRINQPLQTGPQIHLPNQWFVPGRPPVPITCMPVVQPGAILTR